LDIKKSILLTVKEQSHKLLHFKSSFEKKPSKGVIFNIFGDMYKILLNCFQSKHINFSNSSIFNFLQLNSGIEYNVILLSTRKNFSLSKKI